MGTGPASESAFREALEASGEALPLTKRLFYKLFFGPDWRYALWSYAYLRCVDDVVDAESKVEQSLELVAAQKEFIQEVYDGRNDGHDLDAPARYGYPFFAWDRDNGAPLRAHVEAVLNTIDFDLRRRERVLSEAELDAYMLEIGRPFFRYVAYFASGTAEVPLACLDPGSRAYLYADALMDLEEDLAVGLINVPAEAIAEYSIDLENPGPGLERWRPVRIDEVLGYFREAQTSVDRIENRKVRLLYRFYLARKKRRFLRYLRRSGLAGAR